MKEPGIDIGRILDEIFDATEEFRTAFQHGMNHESGEQGPKDWFKRKYHWDENQDFYPSYGYPPANISLTPEREMVLEFALAGFPEDNIELQFQGDYLVLSATVPEEMKAAEDRKYFKRRLKLKDVVSQRYYVPEDKFDREKVKAKYKNGLLIVTVPPKEDLETQNGIKVEIVKEDEE